MLCPIDYFLESSDIDYMESEDQIAKAFDLLTFAVYEEANEKSSIVNNIEKTIESIIEKIKKIFNDAKDAITNFFSKNDVEKKCKEVEETAKKDPKKKSSYKSKREAIDLSKVTLEDIYKAKDFNEIEALMTKYRSQRNKAIATGVVVTLAIGGISAYVFKHYHDLNTMLKTEKEKVEKDLTESKRTIGSLKRKILENNKTISTLKNDVKDLKSELNAKSKLEVASVRVNRKIRQATDVKDSINTEIKTEQARASALAEASANLCKDIASELKDMGTSLLNPNVSKKDKVTSTASTVSGVTKQVKNSQKTIGEESITRLKEKISSIQEEGKKQTNICKDLAEKMKSLSENDPKRRKLVVSYNNEKKKLDGLKKTYTSLTNALAKNLQNSK